MSWAFIGNKLLISAKMKKTVVLLSIITSVFQRKFKQEEIKTGLLHDSCCISHSLT